MLEPLVHGAEAAVRAFESLSEARETARRLGAREFGVGDESTREFYVVRLDAAVLLLASQGTSRPIVLVGQTPPVALIVGLNETVHVLFIGERDGQGDREVGLGGPIVSIVALRDDRGFVVAGELAFVVLGRDGTVIFQQSSPSPITDAAQIGNVVVMALADGGTLSHQLNDAS